VTAGADRADGVAAGRDIGAADGWPDSILGRVMIAFEGERLPAWVARRLAEAPVAGMTVFRHHNVRSPGQVRELTEAFQRAAKGGPSDAGPGVPLLVAADQEGGQLQALGESTTAFAGNMALGAVGDPDLTERVGVAIGREARAMGVNVVYAPALDLASEPANAAMGIRSFGDDPVQVASLGAAMVRGLQRAGVAATAKHFPGLGAVREDSHFALGVVHADRETLASTALVPFRAAVAAGARLAMSAHVAVPALTGDPTAPATLSSRAMRDLLRGELGFEGVTISDALDMRALAQGAEQAAQIEAAVQAGVDLLLCAADRDAQRRIEDALVDGVARRRLDGAELAASARRVAALRAWLGSAGAAPDMSVVGSADHRALSRELAERSITLVRGWVPGSGPTLPPDARLLAVMPQPTDLTPADTSSTVAPGLGRALRPRFGDVSEVVVAMSPSDAEIAGLRDRAAGFDAVVIGTIDAIRHPAQLELVRAVATAGRPVVAVALRTPWDVALYPSDVAAVCTYSILPDPLEALAAALAGEIGFSGRLPVGVAVRGV
jgi:beta-N-acetylhexosaminidase